MKILSPVEILLSYPDPVPKHQTTHPFTILTTSQSLTYYNSFLKLLDTASHTFTLTLPGFVPL